MEISNLEKAEINLALSKIYFVSALPLLLCAFFGLRYEKYKKVS